MNSLRWFVRRELDRHRRFCVSLPACVILPGNRPENQRRCRRSGSGEARGGVFLNTGSCTLSWGRGECMFKTRRWSGIAVRLAVLFATAYAGAAMSAQSAPPITITLAGQSMIRSDIRVTAPASAPIIQGLLKGDVMFTNLEAAIAEKGETIQEDCSCRNRKQRSRGFSASLSAHSERHNCAGRERVRPDCGGRKRDPRSARRE